MAKKLLQDIPDGFCFTEDPKTKLISIVYAQEIWKPEFDKDKKFVGYRRKNGNS